MRKDIDKLEEGLENIRKVEPDQSFIDRLESAALSQLIVVSKISYLQVFAIAASLALLIIANIYFFQLPSESSMASDVYDLIPTKSLYNE